MKKEDVITLARELFKIRIGSSNEGSAEDDGRTKMEIKEIASYNPVVIEKWYTGALKTAEIVISLEERYLNETNLLEVTPAVPSSDTQS